MDRRTLDDLIALKCTYGVDCPRPGNQATGRCDLHDAIVMTQEAKDLLKKALARLDVLARTDRQAEGISACPRCGREMTSLAQIQSALELAPGEALGEGQEYHPQDAYSFALGHLTCSVSDAVSDLACHAGTCREGML